MQCTVTFVAIDGDPVPFTTSDYTMAILKEEDMCVCSHGCNAIRIPTVCLRVCVRVRVRVRVQRRAKPERCGKLCEPKRQLCAGRPAAVAGGMGCECFTRPQHLWWRGTTRAACAQGKVGPLGL